MSRQIGRPCRQATPVTLREATSYFLNPGLYHPKGYYSTVVSCNTWRSIHTYYMQACGQTCSTQSQTARQEKADRHRGTYGQPGSQTVRRADSRAPLAVNSVTTVISLFFGSSKEFLECSTPVTKSRKFTFFLDPVKSSLRFDSSH